MEDPPIYDKALRDLFNGSLEQVFLYITNKCDLRCVQCFYKTELNNIDMPLDMAKFHALSCRQLGATKITLLGGEPSLYDIKNNWSALLSLISCIGTIGYKHIRLDTNGQFGPAFLDAISKVEISELSFSLDGSNAVQNDSLRGLGAFEAAVTNIEAATKIFNVSVTICIGRQNQASALESVDELARLGVKRFNFHPLLKVGNSQDDYINMSAILPDEWLAIYGQLQSYRKQKRGISMRIPLRYTTGSLAEAEKYCSLRKRDRIHIQANGSIRICPLSVGTPFQTGARRGQRFVLVEKAAEMNLDGSERNCGFQLIEHDKLQPLCISYKP